MRIPSVQKREGSGEDGGLPSLSRGAAALFPSSAPPLELRVTLRSRFWTAWTRVGAVVAPFGAAGRGLAGGAPWTADTCSGAG